jgi:ATP diphosphatase
VVNLSRFLKTPPEDALRTTLARFVRRFHEVEAGLHAEGVAFGQANLEQLEKHWERAKASEAGLPPPRGVRSRPPVVVTFRAPALERARPVHERIFAHLGWRRLPSDDGALYCGGGVAIWFRPATENGTHPGELELDAPEPASVETLHDALAGAGLELSAPRTTRDGERELRFVDACGVRWRYASR